MGQAHVRRHGRDAADSASQEGMDQQASQRLSRLTEQINGMDMPLTTPVLAQVAELFQCQWATLWLVHPERAALFPELVWNLEPSKVWHLEENTRVRTLSLSEGTAGHVWRSRKPVWTNDLVRDMCLPRSLDAKDAGLHGGIWFAISFTGSSNYSVSICRPRPRKRCSKSRNSDACSGRS
jgi:hypothetical protein